MNANEKLALETGKNSAFQTLDNRKQEKRILERGMQLIDLFTHPLDCTDLPPVLDPRIDQLEPGPLQGSRGTKDLLPLCWLPGYLSAQRT